MPTASISSNLRMRLLVTSATTVALLAHALLGCCWHHAYAGRTGENACHGSTVMTLVHDDHDHSGEAPQSDEEDRHHEDEPSCGEVECTFVSGTSRVIAPSPLLGGLDLPMASPALPVVAGLLGSASVLRTRADLRTSTPIHLLYQVLVI